MADSTSELGPLQLRVLRYVAEHQPISVGATAEYFAETEDKARTTILTVMEKLREKGYLVRRKRAGVYHYSSKQSKAGFLSGIVERFVEESLDGSVAPVIAYLAGKRGLTESEVAELQALLGDSAAEDEDA